MARQALFALFPLLLSFSGALSAGPYLDQPPPGDEPAKVDVMFLLDDSVFVTEGVAQPGALIPRGAILGEGVSPPRIKSPVAQEIFDDAVDELLGQVISDHGGDADDYDLAFGVSRVVDGFVGAAAFELALFGLPLTLGFVVASRLNATPRTPRGVIRRSAAAEVFPDLESVEAVRCRTCGGSRSRHGSIWVCAVCDHA